VGPGPEAEFLTVVGQHCDLPLDARLPGDRPEMLDRLVRLVERNEISQTLVYREYVYV